MIKAPKYKIHGVKEGYTREFPATDCSLKMVKQAEECGRAGLMAVVYIRHDVEDEGNG